MFSRLKDPIEAARFCALLGYDADNIGDMLMSRFAFGAADAKLVVSRVVQEAAEREAVEKEALDRAAIEEEHRIDP
jgi:hypothetical protein